MRQAARKAPKTRTSARKKPARTKPAAKKVYQTTYKVPARVARIAIRLSMPPHHLTVADLPGITGDPDISERTQQRYVKVLREIFDGSPGYPKLEVQSEDGRKYLQLDKIESGIRANELPDLLALDLLHSLEGTLLDKEVKALWRRIMRDASPTLAGKLENLPLKFFPIRYGGVKRYGGADKLHLQEITQALLDQTKLRVRYRSVSDDGKVSDHLFDPLTLATYKGGLYVIGYSYKREQTIYMALERIEHVERMRDASGSYVSFNYPEAYEPEKFTDGAFGILTGPKTEVELHVLNARTLEYLRPRELHRTQKWEKRPDGTAILRITVSGVEEVATWVMTMAPWVKVVKPESLREQVKGMLEEGMRLYR